MYVPIRPALAALALALPAAAHAQDALSPDVRCLVIAGSQASNPDPKMQSAGVAAAFYYLGRLDKASPGLDLEARVRQDLTTLTPAQFQTEATRCGQEIAARGQALQGLGQHLTSAPPASPAAGAPPVASPAKPPKR